MEASNKLSPFMAFILALEEKAHASISCRAKGEFNGHVVEVSIQMTQAHAYRGVFARHYWVDGKKARLLEMEELCAKSKS